MDKIWANSRAELCPSMGSQAQSYRRDPTILMIALHTCLPSVPTPIYHQNKVRNHIIIKIPTRTTLHVAQRSESLWEDVSFIGLCTTSKRWVNLARLVSPSPSSMLLEISSEFHCQKRGGQRCPILSILSLTQTKSLQCMSPKVFPRPLLPRQSKHNTK